jgi:hypothetical protein
MAEGNTGGRVMRVLDRPGVVKDPGMCGRRKGKDLLRDAAGMRCRAN